MEYTMEAQINRGLLRYAVQTAMFCPKCGQILDMRRAVQFGCDGRQHIRCAACYDRLECKRLEANYTPFAEVLDGRVLWADTDLSWLPNGGTGLDRKPKRRRNAPHSRQSLKRR